MREDPPKAAAVVNPNRPGCNSGQGNLAAAGVAFVLLAALNREARRRGLFADRPEPDLRQWLDLAAMGAICDVTRLTGFNRALASQGLKVMSGWANPGLKALMAVAKAEGPAGVFHAGFILGPRINAGGRIGRADLGARLLSTDDPAEAADLAEQLDALNASRKEVESRVTEEAVAAVEAADQRPADLPAVVISGEGWHPGVVGIVAGRLRERYRRPVVVIGVDPVVGIGKGSGRSQPGVNLGRAVQAAFEAGHLMAGGGHAMAAGLTVRADKIDAFRGFLADRLMDESALAARTGRGGDRRPGHAESRRSGALRGLPATDPVRPGQSGAALRPGRRGGRAAAPAARGTCALRPDRRRRQAEGRGLARRGH